MTSSLFDTLSHSLAALLAPVSRAVETPGALNHLLAAVGVVPQPGTGTDALIAALNAVVLAKNRIEALAAQDTPSFASIAAALDAAADAFTALQRLEQAGPLSGLEEIGRDLINLLVVAFLESRYEMKIDDRDIVPDHFDSIRRLAQFVARKHAVTEAA